VALTPLHGWLATLTDALNARYDRLDEYLRELQAPTPEEH
jgi:hypothetical protein